MSHLSSEKSPYLLQHVDNPVDWYPWSEEVFIRAREEKKLIFLSIGYSTCHWCHVMAHECFEDEDVAALLNADYLSIKVDREERPDIDQVYMDVCQRLTGSGGWPLTIIMTPEAKPFYAATYIPKHGRHGRPGLVELLPWVISKWHEDPTFLTNAANEAFAELQKGRQPAAGQGISLRLHDEAERALARNFDPRHGGFGRAPKFPRAHDLLFLLQRHVEHDSSQCLDMVEKTLVQMRRGGVYDHLGGGFHRYSTDEKWLVPHFEKMLYDQAGLVEAYLAAWQATGKSLYADTVRDILGYLCRDMLSSQGGLYSAEDADSEGEEGTFYLWEKQEIESLLGEENHPFCKAYNVAEQGNYHDEVSGTLTGKNIPYLTAWKEDQPEQFAGARQILFEARSKRIRPHLDDKVITAWNGMAISAFARAGFTFSESSYIEAARRSAAFVLDHLCLDNGRLLRRYRDDEAAIHAFSEDYAYFIRGLLDLYDCDFDLRWLGHATALAKSLVEFFQDSESGCLYDTPVDGEELLVRPCSTFDGAAPAASSIAVEVLARLYLLTGNAAWRDAADLLMRSLSSVVSRYPAGFTKLLAASSWLLQPTREIVIVCDADDLSADPMLNLLKKRHQPRTVVLYKSSDNAGELSQLSPFTAEMKSVNGLVTAYVCEGFSCQQPVTAPQELQKLLDV